MDRGAAPAVAAPPERVVRGGLRVPTAPGYGGPLRQAPPQRSLEAEFPEQVAAGSVEWLLVHIAAGAPSARGLALDLPAGEQLDVLVQPRKGFAVEGPDRGTIAVPTEGDSMPLQFKLRALDAGQGLIRVLAFHSGESLGMIELAPVVEAVARPAVRGRTAAGARKTQPLTPASPQVPDLTMFIEQREAGGNVEYLIRLTATDPALDLNLRPFGPFRLTLDPGKFFADFFHEIEELPLDTPAQRDVAERRLAAKGAYLAEALFPPPLRDKLWEVRDRIRSVIVQSEEPWIPWELCKLSGKDGDRLVEGPFLSEAYAITRWSPGIGFKRPIRLQNIALVVPPDSGLPLANEERDQVLSLAGPKRKVTAISATFADLQDAFIAGTYDGWHFTGHGVARDANPDRSAIVLAADERFTPEDLSGQATNVGIPRPLVFINACQVGRSGMALTGIGGWARRFIGAGAAAFIGAYWSVYDEPASKFSKELYAQLLAGKAIGEAVRDARSKIRTPGDPTWLAYTVFADPLATVAA
ncbi:MAG: CHAT domain-containing protein [Chloroflexi bacterium]|nr:CHAT domain-containing protein [Chloroflexota bacterium]